MTRAGDIAMLERIYEIWNEGDVARIAEHYWSDRIEWHDPPELEAGGISVGRDAVIARIVQLAAEIGVPLMQIARITPLGREYVVELDFAAAPAAAALPVGTVAYVHVVRMEADRVARLRTYVDAASAFAAVAGAEPVG